MFIDKEMLKADFEKTISKLELIYQSKTDEYFFTEKELHSYFYHLIIENGSFVYDKYNLVHTEYPTPFKCSILKDDPYFSLKDLNTKQMRSHIDLVLINPNFIEWCLDKPFGFECIHGIKDDIFSIYALEFYNIYKRFYNETGEGILLYALEFKYFRHTYGGQKYPLQSVKQDITKLNELKTFPTKLGLSFIFCEATQVLVFSSKKTSSLSDYFEKNLDVSSYKLIRHK